MDSGIIFVIIFVLITIGTFYYFTFSSSKNSSLPLESHDEIENNDDNSSNEETKENYTNEYLAIKNEKEIDV